jgi:DNA-binding winged helix-turn-helix (wHTH) protein/Tol biopolymer transport system component
LVRFDGLVFDLRSGELCRDGTALKLQPQPAKVLALLITRAGQVVTREEIVREVWGSDTFVDFEQGLNYAIRQIRGVLNDDADHPRFIETLPKRGYRFIAPIDERDSHVASEQISADEPANAAAAAPSAATPGAATEARSDPAAAAIETPVQKPDDGEPRQRKLRLVTFAGLAVALLVAAYFLRPMSPPLRVTNIVQLTKSGEAWSHTLLTDGPRVYYLGTHGEGFELKQVLLNGNEDTVVPSIPNDLMILGLTPDDTEFLARQQEHDDDPLLILPVTGGRPRRVGDLVVSDAALSHDGTALAYAHNHQLFLANPDGTGSRLVASLPGHTYHIRWSPDDRRLRFTVVGSTRKRMIWEASADGSHLHEMQFHWPGNATGNPMECCGEWTGDGRYFLFASHREASATSNIWAIEEASDWLHRTNPEPVQLTVGPANYYDLVPSRNGKRIFAVGMQPSVDLLRYDAERKDFLPFLGGLSADQLDFSRDGEWVTYVAFPEQTLWRARSDGTEPLQLTFAPLQVWLPRWSADGKRIVFSGKRPGESQIIYTISADGGNPQSFASPDQAYADWIPNENAVIYGCYPGSSGCPDGNEPSHMSLYRLDLGTGQSQKLRGTEGLFYPRWSPDGKRLIALGAAANLLFLVDLKTGKRTQMSLHHADYPVWSPDSQYVYFNTMINDNLALFRANLGNRKEEEVANVHFRTITGHGAISGLAPGAVAPDGSPIVQRSGNHRDVYALSLSLPK